MVSFTAANASLDTPWGRVTWPTGPGHTLPAALMGALERELASAATPDAALRRSVASLQLTEVPAVGALRILRRGDDMLGTYDTPDTLHVSCGHWLLEAGPAHLKSTLLTHA